MLTSTITPSIQPELIARFQSGDSSALDHIISHMGSELLAFVVNHCPSGYSAEDITQDVWLRVWQNRTQFGQGNFRGWIYQIARNLICDIHRKKRPDTLVDGYDPPAREYDPPDPRLDALSDCLANLVSEFAEAIRAQMRGMSTKEMADLLKVNTGTVGSRLTRGRQRLKECVERKMR